MAVLSTSARSRSLIKSYGPLVMLFIVLIPALIVSMYLVQQKNEIRSRAGNTGPTLAMIPAGKALKVGEQSTVTISLAGNEDAVSAVSLEVSFDPSSVDVLSFTPGNILPVVLQPAAISNGKVSVILGAKPGDPHKGTGILGSLVVKAKTAATTDVIFSPSTEIASLGKGENTIASSKGIRLQITAN